jgi:hypothetical protein
MLVEQPDVPFDSMVLIREVAAPATEELGGADLTSIVGYDGIDAMDPPARRNFGAEYKRLKAAEEEARALGNEVEARKHYEDAEELRDYVRRHLDRRGRSRKIGSDRKQVSNTVHKQIKTARRRLGKVLPLLAAHLEQTLRRVDDQFIYQPTDKIQWLTR